MRNNQVDIAEITLQAGQEVRANFSGLQFFLESAAAPVNVVFEDAFGQTLGTATRVRTGFEMPFTDPPAQVRIYSEVAQVIRYAMSDGGVKFNVIGGTVFSSVQQAATVLNDSAVLTATAAQVLAADTNRRRLICTAHPDNAGTVYLGGEETVSAGNAARRLEPGESFVDEVAAAAALWAFSSTAGDVLCYERAE